MIVKTLYESDYTAAAWVYRVHVLKYWLLTCVWLSNFHLVMLNMIGIPCCACTPLLPQIADATDGRGARTDGQRTGLYQLRY